MHLNNAGAALISRTTLAAMTSHLELEARIGGYEAAGEDADRIEATYTSLAPLVGGRADESRCSTTPPTPGTPLLLDGL